MGFLKGDKVSPVCTSLLQPTKARACENATSCQEWLSSPTWAQIPPNSRKSPKNLVPSHALWLFSLSATWILYYKDKAFTIEHLDFGGEKTGFSWHWPIHFKIYSLYRNPPKLLHRESDLQYLLAPRLRAGPSTKRPLVWFGLPFGILQLLLIERFVYTIYYCEL